MLTIGDGLAAQIPALLISIATGIIVTRSGRPDKDLGTDMANQILRQRARRSWPASSCARSAAVPGLPKIPFLIIGGIMAAVGWSVRNGMPDELAAAAAVAALPAETQADSRPPSARRS